MKELKELEKIKNNFKVNHAARMANLNKAMKPESPEPKETKNTKKLAQMNDLLASL